MMILAMISTTQENK
ncbi:hypothetical protein NZE92_004642 [Salmonella enterica]|nr:hypothetical protein [Salmonella enterica]